MDTTTILSQYAAHLAENFGTHRYIGMELTPMHVQIANERWEICVIWSLSQHNAMDTPVNATQVDCVLYIESPHNYTDFNKFVIEAFRILKPNGSFMWTDQLAGPPSVRVNAHFSLRSIPA